MRFFPVHFTICTTPVRRSRRWAKWLHEPHRRPRFGALSSCALRRGQSAAWARSGRAAMPCGATCGRRFSCQRQSFRCSSTVSAMSPSVERKSRELTTTSTKGSRRRLGTPWRSCWGRFGGLVWRRTGCLRPGSGTRRTRLAGRDGRSRHWSEGEDARCATPTQYGSLIRAESLAAASLGGPKTSAGMVGEESTSSPMRTQWGNVTKKCATLM